MIFFRKSIKVCSRSILIFRGFLCISIDSHYVETECDRLVILLLNVFFYETGIIVSL